MSPSRVEPSFDMGYADGPDYSESPGLWDGLITAIDVSLGGQRQGLVARDVSNLANHGDFENITAINGWVNTGRGPALQFNRVTDEAVILRKQLHTVLTEFSWSCIFNSDFPDTEFNDRVFGSKQITFEYGNPSTAAFRRRAFAVTEGPVFHEVQISTAMPENIWHHVMSTWKQEGNLIVYLNGIDEDTVATTGLIDQQPDPTRIGTSSGSSNRFGGKVQQLIIWNRVLSIDEVREHTADPRKLFRLRSRINNRISIAAPSVGNEGAAMYHHLQQLGVYS